MWFSACFPLNALLTRCTKGMSGATMADLRKAFKSHVTLMVRELEDSDHFKNRDKLPDNLRRDLETVLGGRLADDDLPKMVSGRFGTVVYRWLVKVGKSESGTDGDHVHPTWQNGMELPVFSQLPHTNDKFCSSVPGRVDG